MEWEIADDTSVLPWIGKKSGRAAMIDFVNDSRASGLAWKIPMIDFNFVWKRMKAIEGGLGPERI